MLTEPNRKDDFKKTIQTIARRSAITVTTLATLAATGYGIKSCNNTIKNIIGDPNRVSYKTDSENSTFVWSGDGKLVGGTYEFGPIIAYEKGEDIYIDRFYPIRPIFSDNDTLFIDPNKVWERTVITPTITPDSAYFYPPKEVPYSGKFTNSDLSELTSVMLIGRPKDWVRFQATDGDRATYVASDSSFKEIEVLRKQGYMLRKIIQTKSKP